MTTDPLVGQAGDDRRDPAWELGDEADLFDDAEPGSLAEQRPLRDEDGEDIRQYTGEPVETEDGWVVPVQQTAGPGNAAGSGTPDERRSPR